MCLMGTKARPAPRSAAGRNLLGTVHIKPLQLQALSLLLISLNLMIKSLLLTSLEVMTKSGVWQRVIFHLAASVHMRTICPRLWRWMQREQEQGRVVAAWVRRRRSTVWVRVMRLAKGTSACGRAMRGRRTVRGQKSMGQMEGTSRPLEQNEHNEYLQEYFPGSGQKGKVKGVGRSRSVLSESFPCNMAKHWWSTANDLMWPHA